jgi:hypothetical protein
VKIGRYDVPTPLLVGGVAGVGILVLGQRLTGQAPSEPVATPGDQPVPSAAGGTADLWAASDVGQFPSFVPSGGAPSVPPDSYGWWDGSAPPPSSGPINVPTPPPTTPGPVAQWWPAKLGPPPAAATGYVDVRGSVYLYRVSGSTATRDAGAPRTFSSYVSGPINARYLGVTKRLLKVLTGSARGQYVEFGASTVRFVRKP